MFMGPVGFGPDVRDSPIIIEIIDPVAQAKYTLDTQNKVAHRQELASARQNTIGTASRNEVGGSAPAMVIGGGGGGGALGDRAQTRTAPFPTGQTGDVAHPQTTPEKLGTQTIEGVLAEGTRNTTTWPVGTQGNDRALTSTTETWMSPELKVIILSRRSDPRSGEQTQKLINIDRSEPDPSLFQPPPDYTVVEEKTEFTIKFGSEQQ
jgi:hypothetical protein